MGRFSAWPRARVLAASLALLLAALALLAILLWPQTAPQPQTQAPGAPLQTRPPEPAAAPVHGAAPASAVPAPLAQPRAAPPVRTAEVALPPMARAGRLEVCGLGWVDGDAPPMPYLLETSRERPRLAWERQLESETEALRQRLALRWRASTDPFEQQMGLQLAREVSAAAELARHGSDPRAYRLAWEACAAAANPPACEQLSARRWAQIEAQNAVPWLLLAQEAHARADAAELATLLHRAAQARNLGAPSSRLSAAVAERLGHEGPARARGALLLELSGREHAAALQGISLVPAVCSAPSLEDANRREICGALARLLLQEGRSLVALGLGLTVAERLGLPTQDLPVSSAQLAAALRQQEQLNPPEELLSCQGLPRLEAWLRDVGREGEWLSLRRRLSTP